mmetsp:Transcript_17047/g.28140  ORF Transcript_17047/g.28140 Transcript_17047/m.28140 type:complete len:116 (-) Transcript_17047:661-1008(-)
MQGTLYPSPTKLISKCELSIAAQKLLDRDLTSKSDPMCVLFVKNKSTTEWQEYGRTEVVKNNNSPVFSKTFILDYRFEERQELKFALYDVDQQNAALCKKHGKTSWEKSSLRWQR